MVVRTSTLCSLHYGWSRLQLRICQVMIASRLQYLPWPLATWETEFQLKRLWTPCGSHDSEFLSHDLTRHIWIRGRLALNRRSLNDVSPHFIRAPARTPMEERVRYCGAVQMHAIFGSCFSIRSVSWSVSYLEAENSSWRGMSSIIGPCSMSCRNNHHPNANGAIEFSRNKDTMAF